MSDLMGRNVGRKPRTAPLPKVGCPTKGCDGTMYQLKEGEWLTRQTRAGWTRETRKCQCPKCGTRQTFPILVRTQST